MRSVLAIPHLIGVFILCVALESSACAGFTYAIEPFVAEVKSTSPTEFEITYEWWVGFTPKGNSKVFVHFTDSKGVVMFMDDFDPDPPLTKWPQSSDGKRVKLASRKMKIPENVTGPFEIRMGTHSDNNTGHHAIMGTSDDKFRVKVGQIKVEGGKVVFDKSKSIASIADTKNEAIRKDSKLIEGTWRGVEVLVNGQKLAEDNVEALTVINGADGSWSVRDGDKGEVSKGTSAIDPTKSPKTIDLTPTVGDDMGKQMFGIYEVTENTRKLCFAPPGKDRPTEFSSKSDSHHILVTFKRADPPREFTNSIGMKFVWIPPGEFVMGTPEEERLGLLAIEVQHKVKLTKGFYMGVYPVTQEQWASVIRSNPSHFRGEHNLPIENVSWDDCQMFIKKMREQDKRPYRLPTEAEWEYACRAGTRTRFWFGDTISAERANYKADEVYPHGETGVFRKKTMPVGSFPANAFGLYDMHGNVYQWCQDRYGPYPATDVVDPQGPDQGEERIRRGGSWDDHPLCCRSAWRGRSKSNACENHVGIRLCFFLE